MTAHRRTRTTVRPFNLLLTVGAVLGVTCLLAAAVCVALGLRPMVVTTGSMSPAIPAGSLAFAQDAAAEDAEVGEVVAVPRADGTRVMHRVVSAEPSGSQVAMTLKGDANSSPDAEVYVVDRVLAVRFDVPLLGYPVSLLSTPGGLLGLGALACGLLVFAFRRTDASDAPAARPRRVAALLAVPLAAVVVSTTAAPTWATFTDTATVTSSSIGSHTVVSQAQPGCANVDGFLTLGNIARLTWAHVDARYEYYWELRTIAGSAVSSGTVGAGQTAGSTVTLDISTGLIGTNANYNVVIRARLRTPTSWIAATTTTTPVRRASVIIIGAAMRCGHA